MWTVPHVDTVQSEARKAALEKAKQQQQRQAEDQSDEDGDDDALLLNLKDFQDMQVDSPQIYCGLTCPHSILCDGSCGDTARLADGEMGVAAFDHDSQCSDQRSG